MPLDPTTFDSDTPRTTDGRAYPEHLRPYEAYDSRFLPIALALDSFTRAELAAQLDDPRDRIVAEVNWMNSAEWRGLVTRSELRGRQFIYHADVERIERRLRHLSAQPV